MMIPLFQTDVCSLPLIRWERDWLLLPKLMTNTSQEKLVFMMLLLIIGMEEIQKTKCKCGFGMTKTILSTIMVITILMLSCLKDTIRTLSSTEILAEIPKSSHTTQVLTSGETTIPRELCMLRLSRQEP